MIPSAGYIYLCTPYSHPDPFVREERYLKAMKLVRDFLKMGLHVYSPIVHCHELAKVADLPRDQEFWKRYNFTMLAAAETMHILMLDGWEQSVGIQGEVEEAKRLSLPIIYIEP